MPLHLSTGSTIETDQERRLAELILYISRESAEDEGFGAVKLNKILYFSDFLAFGQYGSAITGAEYQHLPQGPAPRQLVPVRDKLVETKQLAIQERDVFGYTQKRTINLREPNLDEFTGRQIALVNWVIKTLLKGADATGASLLSHAEVGWKTTANGETIDYSTIFLSDAPLTAEETWRVLQIQRAPESMVA